MNTSGILLTHAIFKPMLFLNLPHPLFHLKKGYGMLLGFLHGHPNMRQWNHTSDITAFHQPLQTVLRTDAIEPPRPALAACKYVTVMTRSLCSTAHSSMKLTPFVLCQSWHLAVTARATCQSRTTWSSKWNVPSWSVSNSSLKCAISIPNWTQQKFCFAYINVLFS